eukprot:m.30924 g.30924  ORF g.30924 m.30924 type:complete len:88 (+) comp9349_c0_seq4:362-625(+)
MVVFAYACAIIYRDSVAIKFLGAFVPIVTPPQMVLNSTRGANVFADDVDGSLQLCDRIVVRSWHCQITIIKCHKEVDLLVMDDAEAI